LVARDEKKRREQEKEKRREQKERRVQETKARWAGGTMGMVGGGGEQQQQEGALQRHVMALIVGHLRENNLNQAAIAVSNATMTPLHTEVPPNKLLDLVRKGLSGERDESAKMAVPLASLDKGGGGGGGTTLAGYGPVPIIPKTLLDFR
jgi:hypothetical protein